MRLWAASPSGVTGAVRAPSFKCTHEFYVSRTAGCLGLLPPWSASRRPLTDVRCVTQSLPSDSLPVVLAGRIAPSTGTALSNVHRLGVHRGGWVVVVAFAAVGPLFAFPSGFAAIDFGWV